MSYSHLTMDERNVIYRMRFLGHSNADIARRAQELYDRLPRGSP